MITEPLIDDMDHFFAEQWQKLADDMERDGLMVKMTHEHRHALEQSAFYRERIMAEGISGR